MEEESESQYGERRQPTEDEILAHQYGEENLKFLQTEVQNFNDLGIKDKDYYFRMLALFSQHEKQIGLARRVITSVSIQLNTQTLLGNMNPTEYRTLYPDFVVDIDKIVKIEFLDAEKPISGEWDKYLTNRDVICGEIHRLAALLFSQVFEGRGYKMEELRISASKTDNIKQIIG